MIFKKTTMKFASWNLFTLCYCLFVNIYDSNSNFTREEHKKQKVLLVSLDGFRWDFQNKASTPNLDKVSKSGISVEYVLNVFPTSTLPNHQSIVTGLYPENHGMLDNSFFNPANGRIFNGQSDSEWWNQSTPIWIENEKQGHKSGVCFWPGYKVTYENITPDYLPDNKYGKPYGHDDKKTMMLNDRLKLVVDWLKKDDVTFVALYTDHADEAAHNNAPDSNHTENKKEIEKAVETVDKMVGSLRYQLDEANLTDTVNVLLIGDHGLINTSYNKVLHLNDFITPRDDLRYTSGFTNVFLYTKYNTTSEVYQKLKTASSKSNSHFKVYLKKDIPEYLHVKNNNLTAPILVLPEPGWIMKNEDENVPYLKGKWERGEHGYTMYERNMNPAFLGFGPLFKRGYRQKYIKTVDLYSLMAHILELKADNRDGSFERVKDFLREEKT